MLVAATAAAASAGSVTAAETLLPPAPARSVGLLTGRLTSAPAGSVRIGMCCC
jgi:hypothetical protein